MNVFTTLALNEKDFKKFSEYLDSKSYDWIAEETLDGKKVITITAINYAEAEEIREFERNL